MLRIEYTLALSVLRARGGTGGKGSHLCLGVKWILPQGREDVVEGVS
jgi:hypothetical protein